MVNVFAVPVFFIVFRETLETSIVVSVLLSFLKQQLGPDRDRTVYKRLRNQVSGYFVSLLYLGLTTVPDLVWNLYRVLHMSDSGLWPHRCLLWHWNGQLGPSRVHLGRCLRHHFRSDHCCHGCRSPARLQNASQMAYQARQSPRGEGQQECETW